MKSPVLGVVLVAAVAGAASAWIVSSLRVERAPRERAPLAPTTVVPESADAVREELTQLRMENQALAARIAALEQRPEAPARVERTPEPAIEGEGAKLARATEAKPLPVAAEDLPASVRAALEEIRAEERADEAREREEREAARREERLARWQEELGLSNAQVGDLRTWMIAAQAARDELELQRDEGLEREAYRSARQEQRTRDQTTLMGILTPTQFQTWQEREERGDRQDRGGARDGEPVRSERRGGGRDQG